MLCNYIKEHYIEAEPIFFSDLLRTNIRYFVSDRFLLRANPNKLFLRVSLSSTNSLAELDTGLKRLREYLLKSNLIKNEE